MQLRLSLFAVILAVPLLATTEAEACYQPCSSICTSTSSCTTGCDGILAVSASTPDQLACHSTTCGAWGVCSGGGGGCFTAPLTAPEYVGETLASDQSRGLAGNTLQVVVFYNGDNSATLGFEYRRPDSTTGWTYLNNIPSTKNKIVTAQYNLSGVVPTGNFVVNGMVTNGAASGMAFSLFWTDADSQYHLLKSNSSLLMTQASYVGVGPLALDDTTLLTRMPQLADRSARDMARTLLDGAKLLPVNGQYSIAVY
jgi:hypothetical protein